MTVNKREQFIKALAEAHCRGFYLPICPAPPYQNEIQSAQQCLSYYKSLGYSEVSVVPYLNGYDVTLILCKEIALTEIIDTCGRRLNYQSFMMDDGRKTIKEAISDMHEQFDWETTTKVALFGTFIPFSYFSSLTDAHPIYQRSVEITPTSRFLYEVEGQVKILTAREIAQKKEYQYYVRSRLPTKSYESLYGENNLKIFETIRFYSEDRFSNIKDPKVLKVLSDYINDLPAISFVPYTVIYSIDNSGKLSSYHAGITSPSNSIKSETYGIGTSKSLIASSQSVKKFSKTIGHSIDMGKGVLVFPIINSGTVQTHKDAIHCVSIASPAYLEYHYHDSWNTSSLQSLFSKNTHSYRLANKHMYKLRGMSSSKVYNNDEEYVSLLSTYYRIAKRIFNANKLKP